MNRAGWAVVGIVAFTLLRGAIWAAIIPPLDAPDEPSHLIAVAQIQAYRQLPVAVILDPNTVGADSTLRPAPVMAYLAAHNYTHFRALPYESTQPPLYAALCALLTLPLADGDPATLLYGCRLVSVLLGALTVFAAARAAATLTPTAPAFALGVPLALALWPQFAFQTATVTNDIGLDLAGAGLAWAWAAALRAPAAPRRPWLLGLLTGLGLLTKLTVLATLPATALVLLGRAVLTGRPSAVGGQENDAGALAATPNQSAAISLRAERRPVRAVRLLREAVITGGVAAALVAPWLIRNQRVYGEPTGSAAMFRVIHSIYTTRLHLAAETRIIIPPLGDFLWYSFSSAWAVFGWRTRFLPEPFYWLAGALTLAGVSGAVIWAARCLRRRLLTASQTWILAVYALMALAALAGYIAYTLTTDGSLQGRYTFVALVPFAVIGVGGVLGGPDSPRARRLCAGAALGSLVALQIAAWWRIGQAGL